MFFQRLLCCVFAVVFAFAAASFFAERAEAAEGVASWYAPESANAGEFTAVHATLPAGTQLTVSRGDRWVQVSVVERSHDLGGRDLDLSQAPAEFLGITHLGAATVSYTYPGEASYAPTVASASETAVSAPEASYEVGYAAPASWTYYDPGYVEPYQETYAQQNWSEPVAPQTESGYLAYQPEVAAYTEPAQPASAQPASAQPASAQPASAQPASAQPASAQPAVTETPAWNETTYEAPVETSPAAPVETQPVDGAEAYEDPYSGSYAEPQVVEEPQVASTGYSPGYEGAAWHPASDYGNYTAANRPASHPVDKIIVHTTQGSYESAMNWFQDPASGVSAHYTVRSADGLVGQSVSEQNIAHHAGNWDYNQTSVGIEHEGYVEDPSYYTDAMYRSSAQLGAHLANKYEIPVDRNHIIGHDEVPGATHTDPGPYWDWDLYLGYVQQYSGQNYATDPAYESTVW